MGGRWLLLRAVEHDCEVQVALVEDRLRDSADEVSQSSECSDTAGSLVVGGASDEGREFPFVPGNRREVHVDAPSAGLSNSPLQLLRDARLADLTWTADDHGIPVLECASQQFVEDGRVPAVLEKR